jgi:midasin
MIDAAKRLCDRPGIAADLDGLAVDVIETVQELQKTTPSTLTEENKKIVNNLASRKRKAFSDLLKALRASGFSNNVRADALNKQKDANWLASRPPLESVARSEVDKDVVGKINGYHARLGVLMIALREAFNGHNDDINSQDLERGIGFVESVYASSIGQRDA